MSCSVYLIVFLTGDRPWRGGRGDKQGGGGLADGAFREFTKMPSRDMGNKEGSAEKGKTQHF
jgi:hypothetical protein